MQLKRNNNSSQSNNNKKEGLIRLKQLPIIKDKKKEIINNK